MRVRLWFNLLSCALSCAPIATAQSGAAAAELYRTGLADMKAGRYDTGCPALAESVRLDRRPGSLFTLAECEAKWGKLASASSHYDDYLSWYARMSPNEQAQQSERKSVALKQKEQLRASVPRATLLLPKDAPDDVVVELDGVALNRPALGIALPIDPGAHRVVIRSGAAESRVQTFEIDKGEAKTIELDLPERRSGAGEPGAVSEAPKRESTPVAMPAQPAGSAEPSGSPTLTYVAFGVGAAGILIGGVSGGLALAEKSTVDSQCEGHVCNHEGKLAADRLQRYALVSTIGFGIGLVGVGLGSVLLATADSKQDSNHAQIRPIVGASAKSAFAGLTGNW